MALVARVMLSSPSSCMVVWDQYISPASISEVVNSNNYAAPTRKENVYIGPNSPGKNPQRTVEWCQLKICPAGLNALLSAADSCFSGVCAD